VFDTGFAYSRWNTHRFDTVNDVVKLVVTFGWAKQADKYGYSVDELRVVAAGSSVPVWITAGTIKVNEKATLLGPEVPFAAKWRLRDFANSGAESFCVAKINLIGRDIGTMLDDCASEFCPAAHPEGSPGSEAGALYECVAGCEISAMGWTASLGATGIDSCLNAANKGACDGGFDYFTKQNNLFEPLNFESKSRYNVVVEATDGQSGVVTQTMHISIADNYESPVLPNTRRSIRENSLRGTMAGVPIIASDVDSGKEVIFEIMHQRKLDRESGIWGTIENNDAFAIGPTNGQLKLQNAKVDFEITPTYELTISAVDVGNKATTALVYIDVEDVNEVPVLPREPVSGCPGGWIPFTDDTPFCCLRQEGVNDKVHCNGPSTAWDEPGKHFAICGLKKGSTNQWPSCDTMKTTFVVDHDTGGLVPGGTVEENSPVDTVVGIIGADPEDIVSRNVEYAIIGGDNFGEFKLNRIINLIDASVVQIQVARQTINWERPQQKYTLIIEACDTARKCDVQDYLIVVRDINEYPTFPSVFTSAVKDNAKNLIPVGGRLFANDEDRFELKYTDPKGEQCCGDTSVYPGSFWKRSLYQKKHCTKANVLAKCSRDYSVAISVKKHKHVYSATKGKDAYNIHEKKKCGIDNSAIIAPADRDAATSGECATLCDEVVDFGCAAWQFEISTFKCTLYSTAADSTTQKTGFECAKDRKVEITSELKIGTTGSRKDAYIDFEMEVKSDFFIETIEVKSAVGGEPCESFTLSRFEYLAGPENPGIYIPLQTSKTDKVVKVAYRAGAERYRVSNFGGNVGGMCDIGSILVTGQNVNHLEFAQSIAPYVNPGDASICEICHTCFESCKRFSDTTKYRFKGCFGTSTACDRGPSMEDLDGEVTFEGEPFKSRMLSLRFNGFEKTGFVAYRQQKSLVTRENIDWKCYMDRYGTNSVRNNLINVAVNGTKFGGDEAGAIAHWKSRSDWPGQCKTQSSDQYTGKICRKAADCKDGEVCANSPAGGDENGLLWGCFDGYWETSLGTNIMEPNTFVLTKQEGALGETKYMLALTKGGISAEPGYIYFTTFENGPTSANTRQLDIPLIYSITGGNSPNMPFMVDDRTGQIRIRRTGSQILNVKAKSEYVLTVRATDAWGLYDETTMTVTILPGNDPPVVNDTRRSVRENTRGQNVGTPIVATDEQSVIGQILTYSISSGSIELKIALPTVVSFIQIFLCFRLIFA
jgi:hypothetical protein